jgi:hypothetical protein
LSICTIPEGIIATVWYGANDKWNVIHDVTGSIGCNNGVFGDPIVGTFKSCVYAVKPTPFPPKSVSQCAKNWVIGCALPPGVTASVLFMLK